MGGGGGWSVGGRWWSVVVMVSAPICNPNLDTTPPKACTDQCEISSSPTKSSRCGAIYGRVGRAGWRWVGGVHASPLFETLPGDDERAVAQYPPGSESVRTWRYAAPVIVRPRVVTTWADPSAELGGNDVEVIAYRDQKHLDRTLHRALAAFTQFVNQHELGCVHNPTGMGRREGGREGEGEGEGAGGTGETRGRGDEDRSVGVEVRAESYIMGRPSRWMWW